MSDKLVLKPNNSKNIPEVDIINSSGSEDNNHYSHPMSFFFFNFSFKDAWSNVLESIAVILLSISFHDKAIIHLVAGFLLVCLISDFVVNI